MSNQITRERVRIEVTPSTHINLVDLILGATPSIYNNVDVQFELAFFQNGTLADLSNLDQITLEIKPSPNIDALPYISQTVASGDFNNGLTLEQWESGDPAYYHVLVVIPNGLNAFPVFDDADDFWLAISGLTSDSPPQKLVMGTGPITVVDSGAGIQTPTIISTPIYLTAAQSDARYTVSSTKLNISGGTMTGPLLFSGSTNAGIVLNNLTSTQRTGLSPSEGMLVMDTTVNFPYYYNGTIWKTFVTSFNGNTGDLTVTTDGISEGSTNKYFTNARVIASTLTAFTAGSGTVTSADSVLTAIQKLAGAVVSGTFTSVAMTVPGWLAVAGSPITSTGTLAVTSATGLTANQVLATPTTGTGSLAVRALVAGDIPALAESGITNLTTDLAARVLLAGSTMTGALTLANDSPSGSQAASYNFVNGNYLALTGGTLSGTLNTASVVINASNSISWATAPTGANHLTNKTYVDALGAAKASLSGATFTGNLSFSGTSIAGLTLNSLTQSQIASIGTTTVGMMVYNTTIARAQVYDGVGWDTLPSGGTTGTGGAGTTWYFLPLAGSSPPITGYALGTLVMDTGTGNIWQALAVNTSGVITWGLIFAYNTTGALPLAGGTMVGNILISSTSYAGINLNYLSNTQQNALVTPATGAMVFNSSKGYPTVYNGATWNSVAAGYALPLAGGAMTGNITFTLSTAAGLILNSLTGSTITSLTSPVAGSLLYNSTSNLLNFYNGTSWLVIATSSGYLPLSGGQLTGNLSWNTTSAAGLNLNSLTTTQQNALSSPSTGAEIWNSTIGSPSYYTGSAWIQPLYSGVAFTSTAANTFTNQITFTGATANVGIILGTIGNVAMITSPTFPNSTIIHGTLGIFIASGSPGSSTGTGLNCQTMFDGTYLYIGTGVNSWKRVALSTF